MMVATARWPSATTCASTSSASPDEESDETELRALGLAGQARLRRRLRDHRRAHRPARSACRPRACSRCASRSSGTAAHGSTPWQGDNAVLKALHAFRPIESAAVRAGVVRALRPRRRSTWAAIMGGDALNKVPDRLRDRPRHPLSARPGPGRTPAPDLRAARTSRCASFHRQPIDRGPRRTRTCSCWREAIERGHGRRADLRRARRRPPTRSASSTAGVPAVEFGPVGAGHHGPEEWVSISSLERYRTALVDFVRLPAGGTETAAPAHCLTNSRDPATTGSGCSSAAFCLIVVARRRDLGGRAAGDRPARGRVRAGQPELSSGAWLDEAESGEPQTIMLIGSDRARRQRQEAGGRSARSDTIILVRLDPSEKGDRAVVAAARPEGDDPGLRHRQDQRRVLARRAPVDAAHSQEGHRARDQPRGQCELPRLPRGRERARLRRTSTSTAATSTTTPGYGPDYATIDVKPGYQKICGQDALDYVRYRHEDNDIVRAARQQDFLRQLKQQIGLDEALEQRGNLIEIFGRQHATPTSGPRGRAAACSSSRWRRRTPDPRDPLQGLLGVSYVTASPVDQGPARATSSA